MDNRSRVMRGDLHSALPRIAQLAHAFLDLKCGRIDTGDWFLPITHCAITLWARSMINVGEAVGSASTREHKGSERRHIDANKGFHDCQCFALFVDYLEQQCRAQDQCRPQFGNEWQCAER
jgi:hypothetical protein